MNTNMEIAKACARGKYQMGILNGNETLGGSTLKGKAKSYSGRYAQSAQALISRLKQAGVKFHIEYGPHGGLYSARLIIEE